MSMEERPPDPLSPLMEFARRVVVFNAITLLFIVTALFAWVNFNALLIVFAGLLLAMFLYRLSELLEQALPLPHGLALAVVASGLIALFVISIWLGAAPIERQADELMRSLPTAADTARDWLRQRPALRSLLPDLPRADQLYARLARWLPDAGPFFSGALGVLVNLIIVIFVGIYLAAQPRPYLRALMMLVPPRRRQRARHVLDTLGTMLGRWLIGKALSMVMVGLLTMVGLLLLGVPLAMVLGLIAGLLDFIPYLGPLIASVPAVLIAFAQSPADALYASLLFLGIHVVEGYMLVPLIERRTIALPPALTIVMQLLLGSIAGLAGAALATPLTAVIVVLVTMLYVQDVLDVPVKPPGES